ncbi:MAG: hypothetical protein GY910_16420 [bacterium]|nr:hypothetical protein [bacterium]
MSKWIIAATLGAVGAMLSASTATAGSGPAAPSCVVGVYTTTDEFFFDVDGDGAFTGGTDTRFQIASGLGQGVGFVGDFDGNGSQGAGKYIAATGMFAIDLNENDTWDGNMAGDRAQAFVAQMAGGPGFVGSWASLTADAPGRYLQSEFFLDDNGNGVWDGSTTDGRFAFISSLDDGTTDIIIGDWNGDGESDVAKYDTLTGRFFGDVNGDRVWSGVGGGDVNSPFGAAYALANGGGEIFIGDWDGDGSDNIALYVDATDTFLVDSDGDFLWDGAAGGDTQLRLGGSLASGNTAESCDFDSAVGDELNKFNSVAVANASDLNGNLASDGGEVRAFAPALSGSISDGLVRNQ